MQSLSKEAKLRRCQKFYASVAVSSGRSYLPASRIPYAPRVALDGYKQYKVSKANVTLGTDTTPQIWLPQYPRTERP